MTSRAITPPLAIGNYQRLQQCMSVLSSVHYCNHICSDGSSDIVGFTTLCGSMGAGKVSEMLDHLYTQVQTSKNFL